MALLKQVEQIARRSDIGMDLSVYRPGTLEAILAPLESYLASLDGPGHRRGWRPWRRDGPVPTRVSPVLLTGPVGTGKTTLMMLLDRALPQASCAPLFQQEIPAHPSTAEGAQAPESIELRPLALMGRTSNVATGVIRLRELQSFYRLYTYDRSQAQVDEAAAARFARLFRDHIVFVDEFVPDVVTSFPMKVINHLADNGVLLFLSSNRREVPFVPGVTVIPIEGDDMRVGDLSRVCRPAGPDPAFDDFAGVGPTAYDAIVRGLRARLRVVNGERWMVLRFPEIADLPADWLAFQHLLQHADRLLLDELPLFDPRQAGGNDRARRFVFLIDAIYDERRPVRLRLTNEPPLPNDFDVEALEVNYLPEVLVDLERALSRLRQLSVLWDETPRPASP